MMTCPNCQEIAHTTPKGLCYHSTSAEAIVIHPIVRQLQQENDDAFRLANHYAWEVEHWLRVGDGQRSELASQTLRSYQERYRALQIVLAKLREIR